MAPTKGYSFQKLYADVVAPDGTVAVLYLTWARFWRGWYGRASVERYHPDGRLEQITLPAPAAPDLDGALSTEAFHFETPAGPVTLAFATELGEWKPGGCPARGLDWAVKRARTRATLRLPDGIITGDGYVDFVTMTETTRGMKLKTLQWGRAHLPDRTVIFEELTLNDGNLWRVGLDAAHDEPLVATTAKIALDTEGLGTVRVGSTTLDVTPLRTLHEGDALDRRRIPGLIDRTVARALSGPVTQSRRLGRVLAKRDGELSARREGFILYERVNFGESR
jgi:hypothetical protein